MPGADIAQYGIAFFTVACLVFVVVRYLDGKKDSVLKEAVESSLKEVIENNTKALEQIIPVVQAVQLSLTRLEANVDELLARARR